MGSFAIPLSGLKAAQNQLKTVSNNLANINTTGYKDQTVQFADLFSHAQVVNGAGDPIQTGLGVMPAATVTDFSDGNISSTGIASNMALSGAGFFVVRSADGTKSYTRAGDFTTNNQGFLTTPSGHLVMGYPSVNGTVNTSGPLQPIQLGSGVTTSALATDILQISANLDSNTAPGGSGPVSTISIYDSLGAQHELTISYSKTGTNTWDYRVAIPSSDLTAGASGTTTVGSGTLNFDGNGQLASTSNLVPISIPSFVDGALGPQAIGGPFGTAANPTITQTSSASTTSATSQNGYPSGTLASYTIGSDGTIEGTFSSGKTLALGQVAIATFANTQGLNAVGMNEYLPTVASGDAVVGTAGSGGRGTITGGALEQSNVDIATEFSNLIVAQQDYSASAKSITTFNQISQATLQMIQ
jgi:flagellar hook protein FlgE